MTPTQITLPSEESGRAASSVAEFLDLSSGGDSSGGDDGDGDTADNSDGDDGGGAERAAFGHPFAPQFLEYPRS